ncbi:MAG: DUF4291 domain-containing protein [Hyphomicrobiaceae bacterium]|nr:DUF4291 domain-containing protein [Hyphomicrobiaceae bacterium]
MRLATELHADQAARWPREGRHILAHYDAESIVVYQAYRASIARYAIAHGAFGGEHFSYARMSWIKPSFLWMMYRSAWATKEGQEMTLGLRISRRFFEHILANAVASSFSQSGYANEDEWKAAVAGSEARLQWDPDHGPNGNPLARRAIQLGLRGSLLAAFGRRELMEVIDLTCFVAEQRAVLVAGGSARLRTPIERVYRPVDPAAARRLGLD